MKLLIAATAALALALPLVAEAQSNCPDIVVAYTEGDVIAVESNFQPVVTVATVRALEPCPNGTVAEAKAGLVNQIRLGVIEVQTWGGRVELVPPARVVRYVLPHPGIQH